MTREKSGVYSCHANNGIGEPITAQFRISVQGNFILHTLHEIIQIHEKGTGHRDSLNLFLQIVRLMFNYFIFLPQYLPDSSMEKRSTRSKTQRKENLQAFAADPLVTSRLPSSGSGTSS